MRKQRILSTIFMVILVVVVISLVACAQSVPSSKPSSSAPSPASSNPTAPNPASSAPVATVPASKPIELRMADFQPPQHFSSKLKEQYAKDIEAATQGRVKITFYAGGSLLAADKMYDGIINGIADIGKSHVGYNRGRFPFFEAFTRPLGISSPWIGGQIANDYFVNGKAGQEMSDVHVLYLFTTGSSSWFTKNKQIKTMEDLKGLTIRAVGTVADTVSALGATGRDVAAGEMYDSISKGVIDGAQFSMEGASSFKLSEVCKYVTYVSQISTLSVFYEVMNKKVWDGLPADIQKAITDVSEKHRLLEIAAWNQSEIDGMNFHLGIKGNEFYVLPNAEALRWVGVVQPVIEAYVQDMVKNGYNEKQVRDNLAYIKDRMNYWSQQEKTQKIPVIDLGNK